VGPEFPHRKAALLGSFLNTSWLACVVVVLDILSVIGEATARACRRSINVFFHMHVLLFILLFVPLLYSLLLTLLHVRLLRVFQ